MRDIKKLEKDHGNLKRRRFADLSSIDRIYHWYFDMEHDIVLTEWEQKYRHALELAYKMLQKYYFDYSFERIATFLNKKLNEDPEFGEKRAHRQCITYLHDSIKVFGRPVDVDKEFRRQLYIRKFHNLSEKAEKSENYAAAVKAIEKAAELENFHQDADERFRELLKNFEAKEIVFAASTEDLKKMIEERRKALTESIPEAELDDSE